MLALPTYVVTSVTYPPDAQFLAELGISADNSGCYSGSWRGNGEVLLSRNPSTGKVIARVTQANEADYETCLTAMENCRKVWAEVSSCTACV